ncbi:LytTR family DNA-binding domain-containing protein [Alkalihalobacillus sp. MEB130]|uniref:LytR/AlgR family response regulator transcription factor n=1 Tax=Alkalihalobacillus sp. MEB130 TaxID=2976704 RepID=UPI0028DEBEF6|nr:LytTR family DNA-binding domain-containing protein [Alkalihalobacillus sp. MEB130]MDT8860238.1 LytTR family DNA-binding domain-containing protein [Alkalihalobacillus sp. MEB130]
MDSIIKVIIAEDNLEAQEIIVAFMNPLQHFEVIGIADNGESLLHLNINLKPDLIIADIDMPKLNGIESIASCLKVNPNLKFIYTTAFDHYAVKAFDLNAVDYLVKPIKKERFYVALEKAKGLLIQEVNYKPILMIQMDRVSYFIKMEEIFFIEKENRKTVIHTAGRKYETNESLDNILSRLTSHFFRTHRSFIVNLDYLSHITVEGETYIAHLRGCSEQVYVSKLRINDLYKELS